MSKFAPKSVRYIKLGAHGAWATDAIQKGRLYLGFRSVAHRLCTAKDWRQVRAAVRQLPRSGAQLTRGTNEIREFYDLGRDTLWVTLAHGHLYWAFADETVTPLPHAAAGQPARYRKVIGAWQRTDLSGLPLMKRSLTSALTSKAEYRQTICSVGKQEKYLIRRIRGEANPLHERAQQLQADMRDIARQMIESLHWRDFETLIDMIFARGGWRRGGVLGKSEPDVDLTLEHPTTGELAWVQVKSQARQADLDDSLARFRADGGYDRFISHAILRRAR